jgi:hypothetical protein
MASYLLSTGLTAFAEASSAPRPLCRSVGPVSTLRFVDPPFVLEIAPSL